MTTTQQENAEKLLVRLLKNPWEFDMWNWFAKNMCGTTACLAGHSALLMGWKPVLPPEDLYQGDDDFPIQTGLFTFPESGEQKEARHLGKAFLEIDSQTAYALFTVDDAEALLILDQVVKGAELDWDLVYETSTSGRDPIEEVLDDLQRQYLLPEEYEAVRQHMEELKKGRPS